MNESMKIAIICVAVLAVAWIAGRVEIPTEQAEVHERVGLLGRLRRDAVDLEAGLASIHVIRADARKATLHVSTSDHEWLLTIGATATITPLEVAPQPFPPRPRIGDAP